MFYHDNGKLQVFANTRCGNSNMYHYFGIQMERGPVLPPSFSDDLVIVLRNPLDRVMSAVIGIPQMKHIFPIDALKKMAKGELSSEYVEEYAIFSLHCNPYLHHIVNEPFRILDFNILGEYIPRNNDKKLFHSAVTNSTGHTDPKSVYVKNQYFSLSDLEHEYELYLSLLKCREQISVKEWKEKTT